MRDLMENYVEPTPRILNIRGRHIIAFVGDETAPVGTLLEIARRGLYAPITRVLGERRVEAFLLDVPDWLEVDVEVRVTGQLAALESPSACGTIRLTELEFVPRNDATVAWPPATTESIVDHRRPFPLGLPGVDVLAPITAGGVNLVADPHSEPTQFEAIAELIEFPQRPTLKIGLVEQGDVLSLPVDLVLETGAMCDDGIAVVAAWLEHLREEYEEVVIIGQIPNEVEPASVVTRASTLLESNAHCTVTSIFRLFVPVEEGVHAIVETLDLGPLDTLLVLREEPGRVDLTRSGSNLALAAEVERQRAEFLSLMARFEDVSQKRAIFGEEELEPEERALLDRVRKLESFGTP